jgi:hypothetical protein
MYLHQTQSGYSSTTAEEVSAGIDHTVKNNNRHRNHFWSRFKNKKLN